MNERIHELVEQCYEKHELLGTYEFNKEKFANLILEECAALCEKIGIRIEDERPNRYMGDAALECAESIRKMK